MLPVPEAAKPMRVFEFVHESVAPATLLESGTLIGSVGQKLTLAIAATTGSGLIVIVNATAGPTHRVFVAVTVIVATIAAPEIFTGAVYPAMFPELLAGRPIAILSLVHAKVSPPPVLAEKVMPAIGAPEHTATFATAFVIGVGLIVMVNDLAFPPVLVHEFAVPVTVIVPVMFAPVVLAGAEKFRSPVPLAARPIDGLVLVQLRVAPATLLNRGTDIASPGQAETAATAVTTGSGLTVIV